MLVSECSENTRQRGRAPFGKGSVPFEQNILNLCVQKGLALDIGAAPFNL